MSAPASIPDQRRYPLPENTIIVHEQYDSEGDLLWVANVATHSRVTLDELARTFNVELVFAPTTDVTDRDYAYDVAAVSA